MAKNDIEAVEKALGEPVICEFSTPIQKVRGTLFFISVISIALTIGDLHIDSKSSILGLQFTNLSDSLVKNGLFWVVAYLMIHFIWGAADCFMEWRLRITGTRVAFITGAKIPSEHGDYPDNPRQSTLYRWWVTQARKVVFWEKESSFIEEQLKELSQHFLNKANETNDMNWRHVQSPLAAVKQRVDQIDQSVQKVTETLESNRVPVSLARFDNRFQIFLRSQNLRWLVIEAGLPLLLGSYALLLLNPYR